MSSTLKKALILFVISLALSAIIFVPSLRQTLVQSIAPSSTEVLSVINVDVNGKNIKILKVRRLSKLFVEVYEIDDQNNQVRIDKEALTDIKDAHYKFGDGESNLFLQDIDGEGLPEVIVPTYDKNMQAHLNIFKIEEATAFITKISKH